MDLRPFSNLVEIKTSIEHLLKETSIMKRSNDEIPQRFGGFRHLLIAHSNYQTPVTKYPLAINPSQLQQASKAIRLHHLPQLSS